MTALWHEDTLKQDLRKFPSTFDFDATNLTVDRVKGTIKKLEDDREHTTKLETEDIQISNFLSYLYFLLEDSDHARQCNDESLQKDPDNIIANANKARFLLEAGHTSEVEETLAKLQKLEIREDYSKRKCFAEADLAYAYARSGPWYHQKAVDLYTRVLETYPTEYAWKYGLGLALLRQTHWFISRSNDRFNPQQNERTTIHVAELFLTVAMESDNSDLRAKAYAGLGKAVFNILKNKYSNAPQQIMRLKPKECFEKAVQLSPVDPTVLETCGRFARYRGELDTSEWLLRKSLQINPTCQAYHHLALTLGRRVDITTFRGQSVNRSVKGHLQEKGKNQWYSDRSRESYHSGQERSQQTDSRPYSRWDDHSKGAYNNRVCNKQGRQYNQGYSQGGRYSCQRGYGRQRGSPDTHNQQKVSSRQCLSDQSKKSRTNLRQMIKSPLSVPVYPGNDLLVEAINLIEKTEELTPCAHGIQYDKGIIYRKLGQIGNAVEVFKQIVTRKNYLPNKSLLTNVYEQLGLCLLELSETEEISPDMKQKYKKDGQGHLLHAVQIQSEIVANDPQFKEAWNSYPTLKELFSDETDGKPRQLAVLHMLMGDHKDSISIYEELFLKEEAEMKPADYINMIECYKRDGQYEKCVTLLRSLECTAISSSLPSSLVFDVYIAGAFHAYTSDSTQLAYQHFRRAFKVYSLFEMVIEDQIEVDEEENTKDVLILHSCSNDLECKHPRNLGTILKDVTGLRYTINSEDVLPSKLLLESMASMIQKIPCIIMMTHEGADSYHPLFVEQAIQRSSEQGGPQVLVVSDDKNNIPDIARTKPFIRMPPPLEGAVEPNGQMPEEHQEWIKEFTNLLKLK